MLKSLCIKDVGPSDHLHVEFGARLNALTGDNGLGKTFVLDVAWWALTGFWPHLPALPRVGAAHPSIDIDVEPVSYHPMRGMSVGPGQFLPKSQAWRHPHPDRYSEALALYVRVDGGFAVWDPLRHVRDIDLNQTEWFERTPGLNFTESTLWNGLSEDGKPLCNGLIRDWVSWQLQSRAGSDDTFRVLEQVLGELSPHGETLVPGDPTPVFVNDARDFPTLQMPYGTIPVVHASQGMKRILGLAYLLVWAWREHQRAAKVIGFVPRRDIVLLIDEPEAHLHPEWQRRVVPALVRAVEEMTQGLLVQVIFTTHAPMVLAGLEPSFDVRRDKLFLFEIAERDVRLREVPWVPRGDALSWLVSEVIGLAQARSVDGERAVEAAEAWMRGDLDALPKGLDTSDAIHAELVRVLPDQDHFWPRWIVRRERAVGA